MTTTRTSCQRISSNASSRSPICVFKSQDICTGPRSEEHTSELQSRLHLVCRLLLEKKNKRNPQRVPVHPTQRCRCECRAGALQNKMGTVYAQYVCLTPPGLALKSKCHVASDEPTV